MARFDKSSTKRPKQNAAVAAARGPKRSTAPSIEDTMFFPRLRRHAKWMFVFLAVALGGGFVLFGVGAGRHRRGRHPARRRQHERRPVDLELPRRRREKNPQRRPGLARPVDRAADRRPHGRGDHRPAARRGARPEGHRRAPRARRPLPHPDAAKQQAAQAIQLRASYAGGAGQGFPGLLASSATGQSLLDDKISSVINNQARPRSRSWPTRRRRDVREAIEAYKKIAKLQPTDPNVQLELAQTAQQAGDAATAIAAYTKFLKLAPDDPNADDRQGPAEAAAEADARPRPVRLAGACSRLRHHEPSRPGRRSGRPRMPQRCCSGLRCGSVGHSEGNG